MYVKPQTLGATPLDAVFAISALKQMFGFGKKKAARKANVAQNTGLYTAAFPPGTDFTSTLTLTPALSGLGKRKGAKDLAQDFKAMYDHKDSWLVKNGVATADDYAAYSIMETIENGSNAICDPNETNPKSAKYKRCPTLNGQNVFRVLAAQQAQGQAVAQPQKPTVPAPAAPAPDVVDQIVAKLQEQGFTPSPAVAPFLPGAPTVPAPPIVVQAPAPAPAPAAVEKTGVPPWMLWGIPAAAVAVGALFYAMTPDKPRARRRPTRRR